MLSHSSVFIVCISSLIFSSKQTTVEKTITAGESPDKSCLNRRPRGEEFDDIRRKQEESEQTLLTDSFYSHMVKKRHRRDWIMTCQWSLKV